MALQELLQSRFPYRLLPRLPPQALTAFVSGNDSDFAEVRRKALKRWITFVVTHPVLSNDPIVKVVIIKRKKLDKLKRTKYISQYFWCRQTNSKCYCRIHKKVWYILDGQKKPLNAFPVIWSSLLGKKIAYPSKSFRPSIWLEVKIFSFSQVLL